jgi:hypothetical protein
MKQYVLSSSRQTETHRPRRAREGDGKRARGRLVSVSTTGDGTTSSLG